MASQSLTETPFAEQLNVTLAVPLAWLSGCPQGDTTAAALRALATSVSLAERPPLVNEEAVGLELEVARLHQKTQLLIELLALALGRDGSRPPATAVQLGSTACRWRATDGAPARGSTGAVALWLHPAAPEPMIWPAEVVELEPMAAGHFVHARLLPLGEAAQAALDRHVFLLHRRAVAEARAQRV